MRNCWAREHSECEGKLSREHLVSSGIFDQAEIFVQGFSWCKEERKIGVANLTSRVLCEKHNSILSVVDQAGIDAVKIIESTLPPRMRSIETSEVDTYIDGHLFERWLLKTAINISYGGISHIGIGMSGSKKGKPSPYLLAVIFGELKFSHKLGLYVLSPESQYKFEVGSFHVFPIVKDERIGGFVFHVRGVDFFLNLNPWHAPPSMRSLGIGKATGDHDYVLDTNPAYRCSDLRICNAEYENSIIRFKW